jgi:hypothetical protein
MAILKQLARRFRDFLIFPITSRIHEPDAATQIRLKLALKSMAQSSTALEHMSEYGFRAYSQADEDGILLFIFALVGSESKRCVEICAGDGRECNTANLIINHGWHGLLVDGNDALVQKGKEFYCQERSTSIYPPVFVQAWVTRSNVNEIIAENKFAGDIDLLSLDLDGVDYWVWEAITVCRPRVVVLEYQDILGPARSLTVPYADDFDAWRYSTTNGMPNFCGASLSAFVKLARKKGYRLVGCNRYGFNAFFVRNPLAEQQLPEAEVESCFKHPKVLEGMRDRFPLVKDMPWVEV